MIHAGFYYASGGLKARLCVRGREALYRYCNDRGVGHRRCGKIVVATVESEIGHLDRLGERALANGVEDVRLLSAAEVMELEPALSAAGGLTSPSTGIVDSHSLMQAYLGDAEAAGAVLALNSQVSVVLIQISR